jgi:hypothetical protein
MHYVRLLFGWLLVVRIGLGFNRLHLRVCCRQVGTVRDRVVVERTSALPIQTKKAFVTTFTESLTVEAEAIKTDRRLRPCHVLVLVRDVAGHSVSSAKTLSILAAAVFNRNHDALVARFAC